MTSITPTKEGPSLAGKTAIVTGGSSGIGLATTIIFAQKGARVFNLDIAPPQDANLPASIEWIKCDQSSWTDLLSAFKRADRVDIAVANGAVVEKPNYFEDSFDENGDLELPQQGVFDVTLKGSINFCKIALSRMRKQEGGGSIVMVASASGLNPEHTLPVYASCKGAMITLVRALRHVAIRDHVTVNAVLPSATITNMLPEDLGGPIQSGGGAVSTADTVGWAIYYSATARQDRPVEGYGKDNDETDMYPGRWNGRSIITLADTWTEVEGPLAALKQQWMGAEQVVQERKTKAMTDTRPPWKNGERV